MSASSARRSAARPVRRAHPAVPNWTAAPERGQQAVRAQRRRRQQHLRRLRRDLLEDAGLGFLLMVVTLIMTAGLGVIAIIEFPVMAIVIGSFLAERYVRRRRVAGRPAARAPRSRGR
jgi:hypothetical protein